MSKTMKLPPQFRELEISRDMIDEEARTIEVAFSSEFPVDRGWGVEILDHDPASVRLGRLNNGGAVLVNHNPDDHVGTVVNARVEADRKGRAVLRFGKAQRAAEVFQDVVDGIRRLVSVAYRIVEMKPEEKKEGQPDVYRVTAWEPFEISLVPVPADPTVGVGRAETRELEVNITEPEIRHEEPTMDNVKETPAPVNVEAVVNKAREDEQSRVREILAIGAKFKREDAARQAVENGIPLDQFKAETLEALGQLKPMPSPEIGMSDKEAKRFSFVRAINALANPNSAEAQRAAAFEFEASAAAAAKEGRQSRGITIPYDVMKRDLTTSIASGTSKAGYTVATDLLGGSFIDVLRNQMVLPSLGATFLPGLRGNIAIPKKTAGATCYWVAENAAPTEGALTFGQVTMSPKTLAAYVDFSRKLMIQSELNVEALVRNDLAASLAIGIDEAAIGTSGTNRPTGVRGTSGIGSVAIGTNGGAPTWGSIVNLMREVAIDNALTGSAAYLTNHKVKAKLMQTPKQSSGVEGNFLLGPPYDSLAGYPLVVSNQVPSNLTKGTASGVCSAMFFGVWRDLLIGQWSGIDMLVDPYTGSKEGTVRVTAFADVDVAVRNAESFAAVLDYTTT